MAYATWSTTDSYGVTSLSSTNTTNDTVQLASNSNMGFIRADGGVAGSGKYYFEMYHSAGGYSQNVYAGVATAAATMYSGAADGTTPSDITKYFGHDAYAWTFGPEGSGASTKYACNADNNPDDGTSCGSLTWDISNRVCFALDLTADMMWVGLLTAGVLTWVNSGDPVNLTNPTFSGLRAAGVLLPCLSVGAIVITVVLVTDPAYFGHVAPTGYGGLTKQTSGAVDQVFTKPTQAFSALANEPIDDYYSWLRNTRRVP